MEISGVVGEKILRRKIDVKNSSQKINRKNWCSRWLNWKSENWRRELVSEKIGLRTGVPKTIKAGKSVEKFGINKTIIGKIIAQNFSWNIGGKNWSSWVTKF